MNFENVFKWINTPFLHVGNTPVTLSGIFTAMLVIFLACCLSFFIQKFFRNRIAKKMNIDSGLEFALSRMAHYVVLLFGATLAIQCIGLELGSLAVVFGFLSVGIGFGLQNVTSNFISGLILLFERPVSVGDFVTVGGEIGRVAHINMRSTIILTQDNVSIIVPNSKFIEAEVVNWSHGDKRIRMHCPVGVAYGSDIPKVREVLLKVAAENKSVLEKPEPEVRFLEFSDSSLNFELLVWIAFPEKQFKLRSDLNYAIDQAFRDNQIQIPFPQRDLHIKSGNL